MNVNTVILAAGKGTRMKSALPKVLHELAKKPLLGHVIDAAKSINSSKLCVVYGHGGETVKNAFEEDISIAWCEQKEQLGTGHAVMQAMPEVDADSIVLILYGDVPLIKPETLEKLMAVTSEESIGLLTVVLDNPKGYGRIIRDDQDAVIGIVEEKDANDEQKKIQEINTGILAVPAKLLNDWLPQLGNKNAQGEYYLTDVIGMASDRNIPVTAVQPSAELEVEGVNNRMQLATLERFHQRNIADELMLSGVSLIDPDRIDVRGTLTTGTDLTIDVNVVIEGNVSLGNGTQVGANCIIINSTIGDNVTIKPNSIIEDSVIENECDIGPFARIRPDTLMKQGSRIGNFVETKKSVIGVGSKVNHLTYIGDAEIGKDVNVGAGTITCNYDGANKHKTTIEDGAFIGSNSSLVAPVVVGKNATIGAGSTIGKDAPADTLSLTRAKQIALTGWARPTKKK